MHRVVVLPRAVDRVTMGQVPTVQQVHPHDGLAGFHQCVVDGVVGGGARERLHVHVDVIRAQTVSRKGPRTPPPG